MSPDPRIPAGWPALPFREAEARLTASGAPFAITTVEIRGVPTRIWEKAPPTLGDLFRIARGHGDKTFVVYQDERVTFTGFARAATALAQALVASGVRKGDRVAIAQRNLPEWPVSYFGALLAGAIATPLNAWWTGPELAYGLQHSRARVLIADGERFDRIAPHLPECPALERVLTTRMAPDPRATPLAAIVGPVRDWGALPDLPPPDIALDPEDDATLFYTSGTTGKPKGAVGTHRAAATTVMAYPYSAARSALRRGEVPPKPDPAAPQRAALLVIPLFHVTGCHASLGAALYGGHRLVMMHRWDANAALDLIEREGCTSAGGVPTIAWQLANAAREAGRPLPTLEGVTYGGAPAAGDLVRALGEALPRVVPGTGWGMTETSATFTHHQGEDYLAHPESCGPPLPVCEVRILDPLGQDLPPGSVGELCVKGPNVVRGYWDDPAATAEVFSDGWLRTGDLARADAEGFLTIVDRIKDMLIRGGENIYCCEVENALYAHPDVIDAVVLPVPHPTLGEEPGAIVVLAEGAETGPEAIRAFVAERLAAFKVPVRIVVWDGLLPRNPAGKVLRAPLRTVFAGSEENQNGSLSSSGR
ncbi:Long-chain-fatty-acid--CoA ligase [Methylobacterium tardum]|uniref:Fatty acid--CoA ligase n=1 Tax=Methylobacterium tardum TaxID=374432 RepID=A0AA37TJT0_9HYPH|nr:class I adenylate-forming enzyme family protein [Methylobacterium tardum]URD37836.1 acyl--CoA ligase [Methylobacterium tardum]GJE51147.1 Long-chain-fatty-acid--CoA ligase [Methylobacterium tardum]GLS73260.1 fatty acid--CoA ligase [Methylobacterium tardum]